MQPAISLSQKQNLVYSWTEILAYHYFIVSQFKRKYYGLIIYILTAVKTDNSMPY